jgi:hypothetical protein
MVFDSSTGIGSCNFILCPSGGLDLDIDILSSALPFNR